MGLSPTPSPYAFSIRRQKTHYFEEKMSRYCPQLYFEVLAITNLFKSVLLSSAPQQLVKTQVISRICRISVYTQICSVRISLMTGLPGSFQRTQWRSVIVLPFDQIKSIYLKLTERDFQNHILQNPRIMQGHIIPFINY